MFDKLLACSFVAPTVREHFTKTEENNVNKNTINNAPLL